MKHKKLTALLAVLAVSALGVGALSYYSGTVEKKQNDFNIVAGQKDQNDAGTIKEPAQDAGGKADAAAGLQPDQIVPKDPYIVSNVDQSAWAIMKVEVPKFTEDPNIGKPAAELLSVNADGKQKLLRELDDADKHTVVYGYTEPLAGNNSTKPEANRAHTSSLFDSFKITGDISLANTYTGVIRVSGTLLQTEGHTTVDDAAKQLLNDVSHDTTQEGDTATFDPKKQSSFVNFSLTSFRRAAEKPDDSKNPINVATENSDKPIYEQKEGDDLYWYSEVPHPKIKPGSTLRFSFCRNLVDISGVADIDVSSVDVFNMAFFSCSKLTDISPLRHWNVSNCTNVQNMFSGCTKITDFSAINDQNISNVINFTDMCSACSSHPEFTKRAGTWSGGTFIPST